MIRNVWNVIKKQNVKIYVIEIRDSEVEFIPAKLIHGIWGRYDRYFWKHHGYSKKDYIELAEESKILYEMWRFKL